MRLLGSLILFVSSLSCLFANGSGELTHIDVHYVIDQSSSIEAGDPLCIQQVGQPCWRLAVEYVYNITLSLVEESGGWAPTRMSPNGLMFSATTFSCKESIGEPITINVTNSEMVHSEAALKGTSYILGRILQPFGGTCPSQALEYVNDMIQSAPSYRNQHMVVILTDGIINPIDEPKTKEIAQQIAAEAVIFVVAIGDFSGWTEEKTRNIFGNRARLVNVKDFSELSNAIDDITTEASKSYVQATDETSETEHLGASSSGSVAGAIAGVVVGMALLVGTLVFLKKRKQS